MPKSLPLDSFISKTKSEQSDQSESYILQVISLLKYNCIADLSHSQWEQLSLSSDILSLAQHISSPCATLVQDSEKDLSSVWHSILQVLRERANHMPNTCAHIITAIVRLLESCHAHLRKDLLILMADILMICVEKGEKPRDTSVAVVAMYPTIQYLQSFSDDPSLCNHYCKLLHCCIHASPSPSTFVSLLLERGIHRDLMRLCQSSADSVFRLQSSSETNKWNDARIFLVDGSQPFALILNCCFVNPSFAQFSVRVPMLSRIIGSDVQARQITQEKDAPQAPLDCDGNIAIDQESCDRDPNCLLLQKLSVVGRSIAESMIIFLVGFTLYFPSFNASLSTSQEPMLSHLQAIIDTTRHFLILSTQFAELVSSQSGESSLISIEPHSFLQPISQIITILIPIQDFSSFFSSPIFLKELEAVMYGQLNQDGCITCLSEAFVSVVSSSLCIVESSASYSSHCHFQKSTLVQNESEEKFGDTSLNEKYLSKCQKLESMAVRVKRNLKNILMACQGVRAKKD